jgi:hypothetical protein
MTRSRHRRRSAGKPGRTGLDATALAWLAVVAGGRICARGMLWLADNRASWGPARRIQKNEAHQETRRTLPLALRFLLDAIAAQPPRHGLSFSLFLVSCFR